MSDSAPAAWLKARARPYRPRLLLASGLTTLATLLGIAQAWVAASVIAEVVTAHAGIDAIGTRLLALALLVAMRLGLNWRAETLTDELATRARSEIRTDLLRRIQQAGPMALRDHSSSELATALIEGVDALHDYFARYLPVAHQAVVVPLAILAVLFPSDWISALVLLVALPLAPLFMILIGKGAQALNQRQWERLSHLGAHFLDILRGLTTLKLFNVSRAEADIIARLSDDYRQATMAVLRVAFLSSAALEFFATVAIAMVAILVGFRLLETGVTLQTGLFALLLAPEFFLPLRRMSQHYHDRLQAIAAANRLLALYELPQEKPRDASARRLDADEIDLTLRQIHFHWPGRKRGLEGIDLRIPPGQHLAIVGPSGAGKSTLIQLLLGFIEPERGELLVNGQPLAHWTRASYHAHIAWLPQQPTLFHGSIRENLLIGRPDASEEELREALQQAGIATLVESLPQGVDSNVGELGQRLSGGEAQRIALARAFLRDARLLILDEPTAALDAASERLVQQAIARLAQGRTVISIAHRLHTLRDAERILVLRDGRIQHDATPAELAAVDPRWRALLHHPEDGP